MKAEIIAVGTELLLGQVVNTNATFLAKELAGLGIEVYHQSVVGDNGGRLLEQLKIAEKRSDLLVLCGGLGPTKDDLTKQVVAEHVGQTLVQDAAGHAQLLAYFAQRPQPMAENNLLQVLRFKEGIALQNPTGLAVGIFYTNPSTKVSYLLLPGPPSELKAMFYQEAMPLLAQQFLLNEQLFSRVLRFYGIGESQLVTELADLIENQTNPTIAPYAKPNEVTLRLTVKTGDESVGQQQLLALEQQILARVGEYFYGYGEENSLAKVVVGLLKEKKKTVTGVESLTAGAFQAALGNIAGVSQVFPGGFVTYSIATKEAFLGMPPTIIEQFGTVSRECVEEMATLGRKKVQTDYAVAFSGVAGPDTVEGQAVGTVWIAVASAQGVISQKYHFPRSRQAIRQRAVMTGLDLLRRELLK